MIYVNVASSIVKINRSLSVLTEISLCDVVEDWQEKYISYNIETILNECTYLINIHNNENRIKFNDTELKELYQLSEKIRFSEVEYIRNKELGSLKYNLDFELKELSV